MLHEQKVKKEVACPAFAVATTSRYTVRLTRPAQKQLDKLPKAEAIRIKQEIDKLATNPRPFGVVNLQGIEQYRIRVGDYRVLYTIADKVLLVEVIKVGQRGNFYDE